MYSVLLIDDEPAIVESLAANIPWQHFGVNTILSANDGIQALKILSEHHIDLLITDIRMPHMDGITLLRKVRSDFPAIHCILLTAYGEFEYAKEAIRLGVENYLLKPFSEDEMNETIEKALNNIYISRANSNNLFQNNILLRWASGNISVEELSERAGLLDLNIYLAEYCVICIRNKQSRSLSAFINNCAAKFTNIYDVYHFWDDKGRYVFIIGGSKLSHEKILEIFVSVAETLKISQTIVLAAGDIIKYSENLSQSYQIACKIIETANIIEPSISIFTSETLNTQTDELFTNELDLFFLLEETDQLEGYHKIAKNIVTLTESYEPDQVINSLTRSLIKLFLQKFPEQTGVQNQLYNRIQLFAASTIKNESTKAAIELLEYSHLLYKYNFEQLSPIIQYAITFIHENYENAISLKDICIRTKMNTAYLGALFRRETGMFFNNYLTQYRICTAIQLLKDEKKKISDIAEETGFSTANYFITCFKKQTGMSPVKYRTLNL